MNTRSRSPRRATIFRTVGWLTVAGMIGLALVGPGAGIAAASPNYATVTGHVAFSAAANDPGFWGADCVKSETSGVTAGVNSYVLTQSYGKVIVKAGSGSFANTIFGASPSTGQTVWADTNGDNTFNVGGAGGDKQISHVIFCDPVQTTTSSSTTSSSSSTTDTTTTDTTTTDTTTTDTTTTDTTTTDTSTTTTDTTTTDTSTTTTDTTSSTTTAITTTEPTEPPFPSFPTNQPTTPPTEPPTATPTVAPTGSVLPTQTAIPSETPADGEVAGITARPNITPPPTSTGGASGTPSDGTWRIALLAMAALLGMLLVITPTAARRR